jgi:molybdopterin-guanine dinucleotide biosynthesis protein A
LLDRVLDACSAAASVTVVGPRRPTPRPVRWTREEPPGGGPVPALLAGLAVGSAEFVVLLAADLPFLTPAAVQRLPEALHSGGAVAVVSVDAAGKDQLLASAFRRTALTAALAGIAEPSGTRLGAVFAGLDPVRLADSEGATVDCDTWEAVAAARALLAGSPDSREDGSHGQYG